MFDSKTVRILKIVAIMALTFALTFALAGCGKKSNSTTSTTGTAKAGLDIARSALSTMAPDAKLLVVQTAQATTPTDTPVWAYLFGDPKSDATYLVYVVDGKAMSAAEYGTAGLTTAEWAKVPDVTEWKIDSTDAYKKALDAAGAKGDPAAYYMGFETYVPESIAASSTVSAFTWYVNFDPGTSGVTTSTISVSAKTGDVKIEKP